jgi:hypothetical protein
MASGVTGRLPRNDARHRFNHFNDVNAGILYFNLTQQGFNEYIKQRQGLHTEKPGTVFGIQSTLMNEQQVIEEYKQVSLFE